MIVATLEEWLAMHGYSRQGIGDAGTHRSGERHSHKTWKRVVDAQLAKDAAYCRMREDLRGNYEFAVARGEVRPPTFQERTVKKAQGLDDRADVHAARRLCEKKGWQWRQSTQPSPPHQRNHNVRRTETG